MSSGHLLPPNATTSERALAETVARVSDVPVPVSDLWNPQTCPAALLPWLAWTLHVDTWDASWSDPVKRDMIAASIAVHRRKGTPWAMRQAMTAAGAPGVSIEEWFEYGGAPHYFRVRVASDTEPISPALAARLMSDADQYKNVRSWGSLRMAQTGALSATCRMLAIYKPRVTVLPMAFTIGLTDTGYSLGCGLKVVQRISIL